MYECLICDRQSLDYSVLIDEFGGKKAVCPYCGGDIIDIRECKICGELCNDDELHNDVCDDCIHKHATFDNCLNYGDDSKTNVKINGFVASVLTESQINELLIREITKINSAISLFSLLRDEQIAFAEEDKDWFAEQILKKERNKCQ